MLVASLSTLNPQNPEPWTCLPVYTLAQVVEAAAAERKLNLSFKGPRDHADHSLQVWVVWNGVEWCGVVWVVWDGAEVDKGGRGWGEGQGAIC